MSFGIPVRNGLGLGLTPYTSISSGVRGTRPAMSLDFLNTTSLSGMVTFSRGSNATLVDSTGKITYAPANLLLRSEEFDNASWAKSATTVTANTTVAPDGTSTADSLLDTAATSSHYTYQTPATLPATGNTVTISAYAKASTLTYVTVGITDISSGSLYAVGVFNLLNGTVATSGAAGTGYSVTSTTITSVGDGWYRCSVTCVVGTSASFIRATVGTNKTGIISAGSGGFESYLGNGSGIFLWGAQLEPVTYQIAPSTYVATTAAAYYGPRFDYDPVTLAAKGLLIEEQRTNLQTYSEDFTNAIWTSGSGLTIAANSTVSPDGLTTADTGTRTTTGVTENMRRATTAQAINTTYTLSVFVKANTAGARLYIRNLAVDNTTTTGVIQFNPADGTVSTTYGSTYVGKATMTSAGNGWYRCSITGTTGGTIASNFIDIGVTDGTSAVGGVAGNSVFLYGAQIEAGAFATSYIPTVASQVTRSADVATMTGTNFSSWYNAAQGTFTVGFTSNGFASNAMIFSVTDGTLTNLIQSYWSNATTITMDGGALATMSLTAAQNTASTLAYAYKLNDYAAAINGGSVTTDASGTPPPTMSQLNIGNRNGALFASGHIRQIAYYNTRLPNTTLQALTEIPGAYSASYLAIAGGGSGGTDINGAGGGGGAGGYLANTATLFAGAVYTVTVGAGGPSGTSGSNSSIAGVATAVGGGAGGSNNIGSNGGSGGGGGGIGPSAGGSPTAGQGFKGGDSGDSYGAAGGGGAGEAGPNGSSTVPTRGGNGLASSITGTSVTRAGGGGAGNIFGAALPGGTGGGGAGASPGVNAVSGTANTGGGGGGKINAVAVGTGGSGVVILSVPTAKYTGTTTGSPTVTTSGANTILTFTSSGSYTA